MHFDSIPLPTTEHTLLDDQRCSEPRDDANVDREKEEFTFKVKPPSFHRTHERAGADRWRYRCELHHGCSKVL